MAERDFFRGDRDDFNSLSVRDLLEARDAYHVHLAHLENVVATAIGRYRIRKGDPDIDDPGFRAPREQAPPRTLASSEVRPWSWPCLLVFVDRWLSREEIRGQPDELVPPRLYLPDGRVVPTCVVLAPEEEQALPPLPRLSFPSEYIGGGYPVLTDVQGEQHVGSIGCLVTDGDLTYALTNGHVTGEPGRQIFSLIRGVRQQVGVSDPRRIGTMEFSRAFLDWPGSRAYVNFDVGLIRVDDLSAWTAQVFGIGEVGEPVDLNTSTISLRLIGCPVRAFGGASGELVGEVQALFYRYRSIGGFDYIADLLIGPRDERTPLNTLPGDSGTLWFFDESAPAQPALPLLRPAAAGANGQPAEAPRRPRPIALQWGGHRIMDAGGEKELRFALATCISSICRELEMEVVRDWNIGLREYWGKVGHFKVGAKACELMRAAKLKRLMTRNADRIGLADAALQDRQLIRDIDEQHFIPLADVPDLVWKGTQGRGDEGRTHFADMDQPGVGEFAGQSLLDLCQDPAKVDAALWDRFYTTLDAATPGQIARGSLPFRVWQIYQEMVRAVRVRDVPRFVCAAGILAHYVGDACQPLHASFLHDGRPDEPLDKGVHSAFETKMMDRRTAEMVTAVNAKLANVKATADVVGGRAAAVSLVGLVTTCRQVLPPLAIVETYREVGGLQRIPHMWDELGDRAATCLAEGSRRLACLWESAWKEGNGSTIPESKIRAVDTDALKALYDDDLFLESMTLRELAVPGVLG